MTTIQLTAGCLGHDTMRVRCDLSQAAAPVQVQWNPGEEYQGTQYQCADAHHCANGLAAVGKMLAKQAMYG